MLEFEKNETFIHEIFYEMLFYRPGFTQSANLTKCKLNSTREKALDLLFVYVTSLQPKELADFYDDHLWQMIKELP